MAVSFFSFAMVMRMVPFWGCTKEDVFLIQNNEMFFDDFLEIAIQIRVS